MIDPFFGVIYDHLGEIVHYEFSVDLLEDPHYFFA